MQRYHREMGLPILRPAGNVAAIRTELDKWVATPPRVFSLAKRRALDSRTNKLRAEFLRIDSEIALTFSQPRVDGKRPGKEKTRGSNRSKSL